MRFLKSINTFLDEWNPFSPTPQRKIIKNFLMAAYYAHEITPQDYAYLMDKAERWEA